MRSARNMTQTVRHADAIQVPTESNTIAAPKLEHRRRRSRARICRRRDTSARIDDWLAGGGHRAELICDPAGRLWERAIAAGIECHPLRIRNAIDVAAGINLRAILYASATTSCIFILRARIRWRRWCAAPASRWSLRGGWTTGPIGCLRRTCSIARSMASLRFRVGLPIRSRPRASIVSGLQLFTAAWIASTSPADDRTRRCARRAGYFRWRDLAIGCWRARAAQGPPLSYRSYRSARGNREVQVSYCWSGFDSCSAATRNRGNPMH